jgi:hypothetical protein
MDESRCWTTYRFCSRELGIGVELTEWRGEKESEYVVQRDAFRDEILAAIDARGSAGFQENGTGWTVVLNLKDRPPKTRSKRAEVIAHLLDGVSEFVRASRSQVRQEEIIEVPLCELPSALQLYFNSITLLYFPLGNPGAVVQRRKFEVSLNPSRGGIAICSFHERFYEKAIVGAEKYSVERQSLGLDKLWLVIHYSSPGVFVEPIRELGLQVGYGDHRRKRQETVAEQLKIVAQKIGGGPFERVYFLIDCQPVPFSAEIWCQS